MKAIKQLQVVCIYPNKYEVVFTSSNSNKVKDFAKQNRSELKKAGALKVITNIGTYYK
jgi:hypothetical protein